MEIECSSIVIADVNNLTFALRRLTRFLEI